ncbi:MAG: hypothetical protein B7Y55_01410 [Polynucleobacter sp. 35-46-207]|jgi:hypothetical protein|nr:MAG: hypothetical protein B7Y55_01410 [Polynucleobacter sp. 35-46-207]OZB48878.1 MAG: hypothetical protein B7X60_02830 [Polynucleobacter sp. 39-45-136]
MNGQWIGDYSGTNNGTLIANIDEFSKYYEGLIYLDEVDSNLPSTSVLIRTPNKNSQQQFTSLKIAPINPFTGTADAWENVKKHYPESVVIPTTAEINTSIAGDELSISWVTNIGTNGVSILKRSQAKNPSELIATEHDWGSFKNYLGQIESRKFIFRGQSKQWRLQTSFHRTGRANLIRFINEDIQMLHKHLSARTKHLFNLDIPNENGAFYNLVQHHGYPTPLLDWSYSPYVAAFFAFRDITNKKSELANKTDKVRIVMFDKEAWKADFNQLAYLVSFRPHVSINEFMAIENERMIPQQAVTTVTNIDDIEAYIQAKEILNTKKYLYAFDLPVNDRPIVMNDLSRMGITAGSLFPGLDGACEELKERNFVF